MYLHKKKGLASNTGQSDWLIGIATSHNPFLGNLVSPGLDNPLLTTVYRKPTHTKQDLHGTATTTCLLSTVYLTPLHIGLDQFVPTLNYFTRKRNM